MTRPRNHDASRLACMLAGVLVLAAHSNARAQDTAESLESKSTPIASHAHSGVVLGAKLGAGLGEPWSDFGATPVFELELGYVLPVDVPHGRELQLFLSGQYAQPGLDGHGAADARLPGDGVVHYEVTQQELTLGLGGLYRFDLGNDLLMPYAGLGGRLYFLKTLVKGSADGASYGENSEARAALGFLLLGGLDVFVGPGALLGELSFGWAPLHGFVMRDTNLGALSLAVGYRLML